MGYTMDVNQYARKFLYNKNNSNSYTIVTCHFAKLSAFELILDSFILTLIGSNISMMGGDLVLKKLVGFSVVLSGLLMMLTPKDESVYQKSDAIIRGVLMYLIAINPKSSFLLFPFPIQVKAMYLGVVMVLIDLYTNKHCNFGGTFAAIGLTMGII